jgi:hypothetical protein
MHPQGLVFGDEANVVVPPSMRHGEMEVVSEGGGGGMDEDKEKGLGEVSHVEGVSYGR